MSIASFFDFVDLIKWEQSRGEPLDVTNAVGLTPLMLAAHGESIETVGSLLEDGADPRKASLFGYGVARYASRNAVAVLGRLLEAGAGVSPWAGDDGQNALHIACSCVGLHP